MTGCGAPPRGTSIPPGCEVLKYMRRCMARATSPSLHRPCARAEPSTMPATPQGCQPTASGAGSGWRTGAGGQRDDGNLHEAGHNAGQAAVHASHANDDIGSLDSVQVLHNPAARPNPRSTGGRESTESQQTGDDLTHLGTLTPHCQARKAQHGTSQRSTAQCGAAPVHPHHARLRQLEGVAAAVLQGQVDKLRQVGG